MDELDNEDILIDAPLPRMPISSRNMMMVTPERLEELEKAERQLANCQQQRDAAVESVEAVEYVENSYLDDTDGCDLITYRACPWCMMIKVGHTDDCPRQAALALCKPTSSKTKIESNKK